MSATVNSTFENEIERQTFEFNEDWTIETSKSHILESKCSQKEICDSKPDPKERCLFCQ